MDKFERNETKRERERKEIRKNTEMRRLEQEIDTSERESNTRERGRWRGEGRRSSGIQSRDSCLPKDLQSQAENATASVGGSL